MRILVTGGAALKGSVDIRHIICNTSDSVVNLEKQAYLDNLESLVAGNDSERYAFLQVNICDRTEVEQGFREYQPDDVMHLAAESYVDHSVDGPASFFETISSCIYE